MAAQLHPLLFSEHYLRHRLAQRDRQDLDALRPRAQAAWAALRERYAKEKRALPQLSETDLEARWVRPLFDDLWPDSYIAQPQQAGDRPDLLFYASPQDRDAGQLAGDPFAQALASGESESWGTDLDRVKGKESPHGQIRREPGRRGAARALSRRGRRLDGGLFWARYSLRLRRPAPTPER